MDPYLQIVMGVLAALLVAMVMFALGRKYLSRDRQQASQSGSDREAKDADKAVIEQARSQLESERKDTARTVETSRQAEAARIELDRKEAAGSLEAEQRRLATRVGDLERLSSSESNLKESLKELEKELRVHHADTSLHIDPARDRQIWADFKSESRGSFERLEEKMDRLEEKIGRLIHPPG